MENITTATPQELVKEAEAVAKALKHIKTHQLRNVFAAINSMRRDFRSSLRKHRQDEVFKKSLKELSEDSRIQALGNKVYEDLEMKLILLKPKLAYAAGRQKEIRNHFYNFMTSRIDEVDAAENKLDALERFFAIIESVVAYHKFHEGGKNYD